MQKLDMLQTISSMVAEDYRKAEVFRRFGIDYCCGGKRTLAEVCGQKGIETQEVMEALEALRDQAPDKHNYQEWELDFLTDYIVNTHHTYVRDALAFLEELSAKVTRVHGRSHPELTMISLHNQLLANEMTLHMYKEEEILFPYIRQMVRDAREGRSYNEPPFVSVRNPIAVMEKEHDSAGGAMQEIRSLSEEFTPPPGACNSYRVYYAKLQEFEEDLHMHVHLENNILFPRAIEMEQKIRA